MLCEADTGMREVLTAEVPLSPSSGAAPWAMISAETLREEPVGGGRGCYRNEESAL